MLTIHRLADIFPPMSEAEFSSLKSDIAQHGQREPIWLFEGQVIDGRHRLRACVELGKPVETNVYEGDDPVAFVISLNLHRRHLSESQRAMVASRLATLGEGRPSETAPIGAVSQSEAANLLNVSRRAVQRAADVRDNAPALVDPVQRGTLSVSLASEVAKLPEPLQRTVIAAEPSVQRETALEAVHNHRAQGTGENEWYTPRDHIALAKRVLGTIDLDPATSELANEAVGASRIFTESDNGLTKDWEGNVWLNPPYSQPLISQFVEKLCAEYDAGTVQQAILLTHSYTDTKWFHAAAASCAAICFTKGRVRFVSPSGALASPTQGQAFFYFGDDVSIFSSVFSEIGLVVVPEGLSHGI